MADNDENESTYISYPKAMQILRERQNTTPAELAVWVSFGATPGCGGIPAYLEANITERPRQLDFDFWSETGFDYIAPLMGAWFLVQDIEEFKPAERYIAYPDLVSRWSESDQLPDVEAFIAAKVREDRLHEMHPITGHSRLSLPHYEYERPVKETTMLSLSDVREIEHDDGLLVPAGETPAERRQRLQAWYDDERRKKPSGALKRTAAREGITRQTLSGILDRE